MGLIGRKEATATSRTACCEECGKRGGYENSGVAIRERTNPINYTAEHRRLCKPCATKHNWPLPDYRDRPTDTHPSAHRWPYRYRTVGAYLTDGEIKRLWPELDDPEGEWENGKWISSRILDARNERLDNLEWAEAA